MLKTETLHYQRIARMRDLSLRFADRLPETATELTLALGSGINHLAELAGTQTAAAGRARDSGRVKRTGREALRAEMLFISRIAAVVATETSGFADNFQMPGAGDAKLLAAGRKFAELAQPVLDIFIKHGVPAGFLDELNQRIRDFERAAAQYVESARACTEVGQQIHTAMKEATKAADQLDAIVRRTLGNDPVAMSDWDKACEYGRSKPSRTETPTQPEQPAVVNHGGVTGVTAGAV